MTSGSSSSFTVSWDSAAGATSYRLEERVDGGSWTEVYNGSGTSKAFSGKAAAEYRYRVRACNSPCSSWSAVATRWVVPTAPNLAVSGTSTGNHSISWAPVPGADRYILEEKKVAWLQVHDGSGNNVLLPNRQPWTYYYRIRACNGGGCGSWGQEMKVVSQGGGSLNPPGPGEP